jgi:hypothetical protein
MSTTTIAKNRPEKGEHLSILVGEPDPPLRESLASALRLQGHLVLEAADALPAVDFKTKDGSRPKSSAKAAAVAWAQL